MAMKFTILVSILVLVLIAAQADEAQGLGTITAAVNISGIVTCSVNGSANAPPFANALVELSCGGNVIASAVTNAQGVFNITVNPLRVTLTNLLSSCRIIVATPLSNCNATVTPCVLYFLFIACLTRVANFGSFVSLYSFLLVLVVNSRF
ncbi:phylloplanin-like [Helianthus annuus]|uniref:phylloplanin-like n=1 Tax=Helianthus annuus TaxID=4232 RepID=UPI001652B918|nr:phylloplanin-like [Helianthus annuus]